MLLQENENFKFFKVIELLTQLKSQNCVEVRGALKLPILIIQKLAFQQSNGAI